MWMKSAAALTIVGFMAGTSSPAFGYDTLVAQWRPAAGVAYSSTVPLPATTTRAGIGASPLTQAGMLGGWGNTSVWPVGQVPVRLAAGPGGVRAGDGRAGGHPNGAAQHDLRKGLLRNHRGAGTPNAALRTSHDGFAQDVATADLSAPQGFEKSRLISRGSVPSAARSRSGSTSGARAESTGLMLSAASRPASLDRAGPPTGCERREPAAGLGPCDRQRRGSGGLRAGDRHRRSRRRVGGRMRGGLAHGDQRCRVHPGRAYRRLPRNRQQRAGRQRLVHLHGRRCRRRQRRGRRRHRQLPVDTERRPSRR